MAVLLSHLRFHLVPEGELRLPALNKGNSLRGGFGTAFRRLVCVDRNWDCAPCSLRYDCPYTKVFNPFIPPDAQQFTGNRNIPRPFVFKPPLSTQTRYTDDDTVVFDLVVVGQAIDYLPYFIVAFRELGATGFGLNRGRVQLGRVESITADGKPSPVYEANSNLVQPAPAMLMEAVAPLPSDAATERQEITIEFLTPTTLKTGSTLDRQGDLVRQPAFHHVLKRLRDRVNALATFYGDGPLPLDFKAVGEAAESVETVSDATRWVERTRFSQRRDVPHDLSGFAGPIVVRGDMAPFLPLLRIGEYVHVGKNAVFGNGWFTVGEQRFSSGE